MDINIYVFGSISLIFLSSALVTLADIHICLVGTDDMFTFIVVSQAFYYVKTLIDAHIYRHN